MGRSDLGRTRRWGDASPSADEAIEAEAARNLVKSLLGFFLCETKAAWCRFGDDASISSPFSEHVKIMFVGERALRAGGKRRRFRLEFDPGIGSANACDGRGANAAEVAIAKRHPVAAGSCRLFLAMVESDVLLKNEE